MQVNASQPLSGIKVQNLTFCGSSTLSPNPNPSTVCPPPAQETTCGIWTDEATINNSNPALCTALWVQNADTGTNPASPFANTGPYSVEVANSDFEHATGHAIALWPNIGQGYLQKVNDIYIHDSVINSSGVTGILIGATGSSYGLPGERVMLYQTSITMPACRYHVISALKTIHSITTILVRSAR
jgi:hypothetical protein